ncbi:MAG: type I 3-dehydroquinate dehydratase [Planctomycetota bacterium]
MTLLAASVFGDSIGQLRERISEAASAGADLIELRIDLMGKIDDCDLRDLITEGSRSCPIILTIRSAAEGGAWSGADDDRIDRLIELGATADYIDIESATLRQSASIRQKVGLALREGRHVSKTGSKKTGSEEETDLTGHCRLILSWHDTASRPARLQAGLLEMLAQDARAVVKIAYPARTVRDNFEIFELMRMCPRPLIAICMGEDGLLSRVLAKKFGGFATFAAVGRGRSTAPGQLTIAEMKQCYRWDAIDSKTRVYGVIGDPISHSLSPAVHNAAFASIGHDGVYVPLRIDPSYESFKAFMVEVQARPWLDFRGFSVTIPHKENAHRYIRESGGNLDTSASKVGAVNTIVIEDDGGLHGYNTDAPAAVEAIGSSLGGGQAALAGQSVAVLGAGGVARAVVAALVGVGTDVTVYNRTEARARRLAESFGCRHRPWEERAGIESSIAVNCTSVGMWPDVEASPMPEAAFQAGMTVLDTVYRPLQTRMLHDAGRRGCTTVDGLTLFAGQAQRQCRLWTGRELSVASFRQAALHSLGNEDRDPGD